VSGVHRGIDVWNGGPRDSRGRGGFMDCLPLWPNVFSG